MGQIKSPGKYQRHTEMRRPRMAAWLLDKWPLDILTA